MVVNHANSMYLNIVRCYVVMSNKYHAVLDTVVSVEVFKKV